MKTLAVILKRGLMIWGAVSLLGLIIFYATVAYQMSTRKTKIVESEDQDVNFVLEWFGVGHDHIVNIENSYNPTGSWSGDYMKVFAIKITDIKESELTQKHDVIRGDNLSKIIRNCVQFVTSFTKRDELSWFPTSEQIFSSAYYVIPVRTVLYGIKPDAVKIIFIRPSDRMVFFASIKI